MAEHDKFYEEEAENSQSVSIDDGQIDDTKFFLELLKSIRALVNTSRNVPFSRVLRIVNADEINSMLDDMEANLPDAIQYGNQMYAERERIMGNAEKGAMSRLSSAEVQAQNKLKDAIEEARQMIEDARERAQAMLEDARERAEKMVEENEIVMRANEEAWTTKNNARVEASEIKLKARHEARQTVAAVEDELQAALNNISRKRKELDEELE